VVADFASDNGVCWPSQATIARKACCSTRTVQRKIKQLEDLGYLEIKRKIIKLNLKKNSYRIRLERDPDPVPEMHIGDNLSSISETPNLADFGIATAPVFSGLQSINPVAKTGQNQIGDKLSLISLTGDIDDNLSPKLSTSTTICRNDSDNLSPKLPTYTTDCRHIHDTAVSYEPSGSTTTTNIYILPDPWFPDSETVNLLHDNSVPTGYIDDYLEEFCLYWRKEKSKKSHSAWNSRFYSQCLEQYQKFPHKFSVAMS